MAAGSIYNSLLQQSSLLAYVEAFRWLTLLSFISILVVLDLKRVSANGATSTIEKHSSGLHSKEVFEKLLKVQYLRTAPCSKA